MLLVTCYFSSVACFYKFVWSSSRGCIWGVCALGHYDFIFIREKMENIIPFEDPPSALTRTCQAAMVCANCFESAYTVLALDCFYSYTVSYTHLTLPTIYSV